MFLIKIVKIECLWHNVRKFRPSRYPKNLFLKQKNVEIVLFCARKGFFNVVLLLLLLFSKLMWKLLPPLPTFVGSVSEFWKFTFYLFLGEIDFLSLNFDVYVFCTMKSIRCSLCLTYLTCVWVFFNVLKKWEGGLMK